MRKLSRAGQLTFALAAAVGLAGVAPVSVSSHPGPTLTRLLPPANGQTYLGMSVPLWDTRTSAWGDTRDVDTRLNDVIANELGGRKPAFFTVWAGWPSPPQTSVEYPSADIAKAQQYAASKLVYLNWVLEGPSDASGYHGYTTKDVAAGSLDPFIHAFAQDVREGGAPTLIRLFPDFNGDWAKAISPLGNPSLTPADFVAAWRRVVDIFRAEGVANASFAWVPFVYPAVPVSFRDPNIDAYYPGDDYVDWMGADTADTESIAELDGAYALAVAHAKPFFLADWMVRHEFSSLTPAEDQTWLSSIFDYIESHPDIEATAYLDIKGAPETALEQQAPHVFLDGGQVSYRPYDPAQTAYDDTNDGRLLAESGADFRGTFARRTANGHYTSIILTDTVAGPPLPDPVATLRTIHPHGTHAEIRWHGNGVATNYDVEIRQPPHRWRFASSHVYRLSLTIKGVPGHRYQVRIRARDATNFTSAWSAIRTFRLAALRVHRRA